MKQKAKARKTTRELVPAASISSSPALAAQPPQPVCRGLSRVATNPIELSKRFNHLPGLQGETRTSNECLIKCFWNSCELEIREAGFVAFT
jgi:hypothetical protein